MPKCSSSLRLCRVSSAAIRSTSFNTRSARKVMSSRFPRGVATTYNVPGRTTRPGFFATPPAGTGALISQPEEGLDALTQELRGLHVSGGRLGHTPTLFLLGVAARYDVTQWTEQRG